MWDESEPSHLVGDQVLADGQGHLDGVGFVCDGDGVHLELVFPVQSVGLAHRLLKHLLVTFLTQHGPDVHQPRFTTTAGHGAALQHGEEQHATQLHWEEEKQREVREHGGGGGLKIKDSPVDVWTSALSRFTPVQASRHEPLREEPGSNGDKERGHLVAGEGTAGDRRNGQNNVNWDTNRNSKLTAGGRHAWITLLIVQEHVSQCNCCCYSVWTEPQGLKSL